MNQLVTVDPHQSQSLVPQNLHEALSLAEMLSKSRMIPKELQGSPADIYILMEQARRWQIDFFSLAQEVSFPRGRPMYSGKLTAAVVNARGGLTKRLSYDYKGKGDDRTITVSGLLQGESQPRIVDVRYGDAKTSNEQWTKQPDQMLMYHGVRVWARRHTPELMLGIYGPDEFDEVPGPAQPSKVRKVRHPVTGEVIEEDKPVPPPSPPMPDYDQETGEVFDTHTNSAASPASPSAADAPAPSPTSPENGAGDDMGPDPKDLFVTELCRKIQAFTNVKALGDWWNSDEQKKARRDFELSKADVKALTEQVTAKRDALMNVGATGK